MTDVERILARVETLAASPSEWDPEALDEIVPASVAERAQWERAS